MPRPAERVKQICHFNNEKKKGKKLSPLSIETREKSKKEKSKSEEECKEGK
jgi:hypothetical protein